MGREQHNKAFDVSIITLVGVTLIVGILVGYAVNLGINSAISRTEVISNE